MCLTGLWLQGATCDGRDSSLALPTDQKSAACRVDLLARPVLRRLSSPQPGAQHASSSQGRVQEGTYLCPVYYKSSQGVGPAQQQLLLDLPLQLPPACQQETMRLHGVSLSFSAV